MIYLLDDKRNRQIDFGWSEKLFNVNRDWIRPVYSYQEVMSDNLIEKIFLPGNIVVFHESFFDNVFNDHKKSSIEIRKRLTAFAEIKNDFRVVYFSGSKNTRKITGNIAYMPVAEMYQNLDVFIDKLRSGDINLKYLLFGKNFRIEEILLDKLVAANNEFDSTIINMKSSSKNFIIRTDQHYIEKMLENARYETFFLEEKHGYEVTEEYLSEIIALWFTNEEYDNLFIPLCF